MQNKDEFARLIVEEELGVRASNIQRFTTGLSHYVYDVSAAGFSCVIRIARLERNQEFKRGIKWHEIIESVGVRLPKIFEVGEINGHHFAVYERLKGDDLENVYSLLSVHEKRSLAEEVAEIQRKISVVDQCFFEKTIPWYDFLQGIISRSEREILPHGGTRREKPTLAWVKAVLDAPYGYRLVEFIVTLKGGCLLQEDSHLSLRLSWNAQSSDQGSFGHTECSSSGGKIRGRRTQCRSESFFSYPQLCSC